MRGRVLHLVSMQHADGSWRLSEELADVIGWRIADLLRRLVDFGEDSPESRDAWATAMALAWLERYGNDTRDEWELIAHKGHRWFDRLQDGRDTYRKLAFRAIEERG